MSKLVERVVVKQLMLSTVTILIILGNLHTKVVTPPKLPCCISKTRFISHYHRASLLQLVLLDLSAAFDTIDHTSLLNCLKSWFGMCCMALEVVHVLSEPPFPSN